jgi:hypothetical protein
MVVALCENVRVGCARSHRWFGSLAHRSIRLLLCSEERWPVAPSDCVGQETCVFLLKEPEIMDLGNPLCPSFLCCILCCTGCKGFVAPSQTGSIPQE